MRRKLNAWPLIGIAAAVGSWVLVVAFIVGVRTLVKWWFP